MWTFVMNHSTEAGLVLFVVCFLFIMLFALTRTRRQLDGWAQLPLGSNDGGAESWSNQPATTPAAGGRNNER